MKDKLFLILIVFVCEIGFGQCNIGEVEVTIDISTDDYGYEGYWQLVPNGNTCGTATIAEGGNTAVGCNGAGLQNQTPGGYGNNLTINEGPWCLIEGNQYDLIYVDDWGDGGFNFNVNVNGYQTQSFDGIGLGATFTFTAEEPPQYDLAVTGSNIYSYLTIGSYDLDAHVFNNGTANITSYDLNYKVNGGATQTHAVTATSLPNFSDEEVQHNIPISIASNGIYSIKIWADNINGSNIDENNSNDTLIKVTEAGPGTPNYIDAYVGNNWTNIVQIAGPAEQISTPTDLDFHPVLSNYELWVCNKRTENQGGSTVTIYNAGSSSQTSIHKVDGNAWHFMSLPTGIAFSDNGNWANSPGVYDANHNGGDAFTGPALWSSDMAIYGEPSGGNGSHLDMLHLSPYSQGIAAEVDNVFWIFDGYTNDIVRYDFAEDHGPGNSFHGDAIVRRYSDDAIAKDPNDQIVSHLVLDKDKKWLYVVDHGNNRVIRIDITTGSDQGGTVDYPQNEALVEYSEFTGYTQETVVAAGDLSKPAGIDVIDDRMIVSEYESGDIIIYDISVIPALELHRINTELNSLQGVKIGPDGRIWFVDYNSNGVYRVEAPAVGVQELNLEFNIYPNPSNGTFEILSEKTLNGLIEVFDMQGRLVYSSIVNSSSQQVSLSEESGLYSMKYTSDMGEIKLSKIILK